MSYKIPPSKTCPKDGGAGAWNRPCQKQMEESERLTAYHAEDESSQTSVDHLKILPNTQHDQQSTQVIVNIMYSLARSLYQDHYSTRQ